MARSLQVGRYFFIVALAVFGLQYILYATGASPLRPGPPWVFAGPISAVVAGAALMIASGSLALRFKAHLGALTLGVVLLAYALGYYALGLMRDIHDAAQWTSGAEVLCLAGVAFGLAGALTFTQHPSKAPGTRLLTLGRTLYAAPLVVFGVQHIIYADFVVSLVPRWIPGSHFWIYFVAIAFFAASLSILTGRLAALAASLLGFQFLLWVLVLHIPRTVAAQHGGNDWTSTFIALAMSGGGFVIAGGLTASRSTAAAAADATMG